MLTIVKVHVPCRKDEALWFDSVYPIFRVLKKSYCRLQASWYL